MSADNGIYVHQCYDRPNRFGIWYYCSSVDNPPSWFNTDNAEFLYSDAIAAVIAAHRLQDSAHTEYGVDVDSRILMGTEIWLERFRVPKDA